MILDLFRQAPWLTAERIRRFALVFALCALAMLAFDFWTHAGPGHVDAHGEQLARDFVNYWSGARIADQGHATAAYDINGFLAYQRGLTAPNAEFKWYGYPPSAMLLTLPLGLLAYVPALALWLVGGALIGAWMLRAGMGWRMALLAQVATPAAFLNAYAGQNGQYSAVLLAGGVMLLDRRPWIAGVLFGLLSYKPQLGLLIPVALLAAGQWRAFLSAGVAVVGLGLASGLLLGWDAWAAFIAHTPLHRALLEHGESFWPRMPSLYAAARLLGLGNLAAYGVQALSALGAVVAVFLAWRSRAPTPVKGAALAAGAFLASPYAWDYDMVVLIFAALWMWSDGAARGFRPWEKLTTAAVIVSPLLAPAIAGAIHIQPTPILLWTWLILIVRRARAMPAGQAAATPIPAPSQAGAEFAGH